MVLFKPSVPLVCSCYVHTFGSIFWEYQSWNVSGHSPVSDPAAWDQMALKLKNRRGSSVVVHQMSPTMTARPNASPFIRKGKCHFSYEMKIENSVQQYLRVISITIISNIICSAFPQMVPWAKLCRNARPRIYTIEDCEFISLVKLLQGLVTYAILPVRCGSIWQKRKKAYLVMRESFYPEPYLF